MTEQESAACLKEARCSIYFTENTGKITSFHASCVMKVQMMDQVCRVPVSRDVPLEGGEDHFSSVQRWEEKGREAGADQWRQVELGMGWP